MRKRRGRAAESQVLAPRCGRSPSLYRLTSHSLNHGLPSRAKNFLILMSVGFILICLLLLNLRITNYLKGSQLGGNA